jgi:hypothetical protein
MTLTRAGTSHPEAIGGGRRWWPRNVRADLPGGLLAVAMAMPDEALGMREHVR